MSRRDPPRLLICCVDGGLARLVRRHGLFGAHGGAVTVSPVAELTTVFPSSTAPAHASMLTGRHPEGHGIVGNRYWAAEPVSDIRCRAADPVASLHPYQRDSLTAPSLLDWFAEKDLSAAAVRFPHTFSARTGDRDIPSLYCLYAPAREREAAAAGPGSETDVASFRYFGHEMRIELRPGADGCLVTAGVPPGVVSASLRYGAPERLTIAHPEGLLCLPVMVSRHGSASLRLKVGRGCCVGGARAVAVVAG